MKITYGFTRIRRANAVAHIASEKGSLCGRVLRLEMFWETERKPFTLNHVCKRCLSKWRSNTS